MMSTQVNGHVANTHTHTRCDRECVIFDAKGTATSAHEHKMMRTPNVYGKLSRRCCRSQQCEIAARGASQCVQAAKSAITVHGPTRHHTHTQHSQSFRCRRRWRRVAGGALAAVAALAHLVAVRAAITDAAAQSHTSTVGSPQPATRKRFGAPTANSIARGK